MIETFAFPLLVALVAELARRRMHPPGIDRAAPPWAWNAARAAVLLAGLLWFGGTPMLGGAPLMMGDSAGHALVGHAIASGLAPHGWIDAIGSGFPLGYHYPPLGFGVLAALVEAGLSPARAVAAVAMFAWFAVPLVVLEASRVYRIHPVAGLAGAFFVMTLEPYASFIGGWPTVARMGLVSQAIGAVFAAVWMASAPHERGRRTAGLAAVGLMATHPQVFTSALAALAIGGLAAWDRRVLARIALSAAPAALLGVALYAPGVATLGAPFGWPRAMGWYHTGPPPYRLADYLDGWLVDFRRPPYLTALWSFALFVLVLRPRWAVARAAIATSIGITLFAISGEWIGGLGAVGRAVMSVFQPLRMLTVLPLLGAAAVVFALDATIAIGAHVLARLGDRTRPRLLPARWSGRVAASLVVLAALVALIGPEVVARSTEVRRWLVSLEPMSEQRICKIAGVAVTVDDELRTRLRELRGGRFVIGLPIDERMCLRAVGLELDAPIPKGATSAVGAHVGVAFTAFAAVENEQLDVAEALGVRWVLTRASLAPHASFRVAWSCGPLALLERTTGSDMFGAACVAEEWRGGEADLSGAVFDALADPPRLLGDPRRLIALEKGSGPLARTAVSGDGCDPTGASISEVPRAPGELEATVEARAPVDVVLRASAFPAWRIEVDGAAVPFRRVAPGFMSVRVPEGRHRITAAVSLAGYARVVLVALFIAVGAVLISAETVRGLVLRARRRGACATE